jgi:hypothetical protein
VVGSGVVTGASAVSSTRLQRLGAGGAGGVPGSVAFAALGGDPEEHLVGNPEAEDWRLAAQAEPTAAR